LASLVGEYGLARQYELERLAILERTYGREDSRVAYTLRALASLAQKDVNYRLSRKYKAEALEIMEQVWRQDRDRVDEIENLFPGMKEMMYGRDRLKDFKDTLRSNNFVLILSYFPFVIYVIFIISFLPSPVNIMVTIFIVPIAALSYWWRPAAMIVQGIHRAFIGITPALYANMITSKFVTVPPIWFYPLGIAGALIGLFWTRLGLHKIVLRWLNASARDAAIIRHISHKKQEEHHE
jgi:hypothetical protein